MFKLENIGVLVGGAIIIAFFIFISRNLSAKPVEVQPDPHTEQLSIRATQVAIEQEIRATERETEIRTLWVPVKYVLFALTWLTALFVVAFSTYHGIPKLLDLLVSTREEQQDEMGIDNSLYIEDSVEEPRVPKRYLGLPKIKVLDEPLPPKIANILNTLDEEIISE